MGYTHYWKQNRNFTLKDWDDLCGDLQSILDNVQHVQGIVLANGLGDRGTQPEITKAKFAFNGVDASKTGGEDDSHETFYLERTRTLESWQTKEDLGRAFCKTARKPYDIAVTACLAYLASVHNFTVASDGDGQEWLEGVALAQRAIPRYANVIDIPLDIRKGDRWDYIAKRNAKLGNIKSKRYTVGFCIDGHAYAYDVKDESKCYRFDTHDEAAQFFAKFKEARIYVKGSWGGWEGGDLLFDSSGAYDQNRHAKLQRAQDRILKQLIEGAPVVKRNKQPPAFARPNVLAGVPQENASFADLFSLAA